MSRFRKAVKTDRKLRLALCAPTGGGKTYSALAIARGIADAIGGGRVALLDSERDSASLYAEQFAFDTAPIRTGNPQEYVDAMRDAAAEAYDVVIVDSMSHAWIGQEGALRLVDRAARGNDNSFTAWRSVTPLHDAFVAALLDYPGHVIVTMRLKMKYELVANEKGKMVPTKIGLQPVERDGVEYEFDVVGDLDQDHVLRISKTRIPVLDHKEYRNPGPDLGRQLIDWLRGAPPRVDDMDVPSIKREFQDIEGRIGEERFAELVPTMPGTLREARETLAMLRDAVEADG